MYRSNRAPDLAGEREPFGQALVHVRRASRGPTPMRLGLGRSNLRAGASGELTRGCLCRNGVALARLLLPLGYVIRSAMQANVLTQASTRTLFGAIVIAATMQLAAAQGSVDDGMAAYRAGDYVKAFETWRPLAEQGDALA